MHDTLADDPWGAHVSTYDRIYAPMTGYIARSLLSAAEARLAVNARILDIACGSGALFMPAVERAERRRAMGGTDHVVGSDFSPGMLSVAQRKAEKAYDAELFHCDVQNGQALTYEDASFDAVFSCFGIFLFEDRHAGWREAARVLAPGGVFGTAVWMAPEHNEMFRTQFGPMVEALPSRITENMQPPGWLDVAHAEGLRSEVQAAGFVDVEVHPFHTHFVIPSAEDAWAAMLDNPSGGSLLRQCDDAERAAIKARVLEALQARTSGTDHPLVLEASCNLLIARKAA
ncbi:MAG: class I SAM-dependent methyltransferase [Bradymonadia bacterium]